MEMRIQSDGVIVGQPALTIRKLLKQERGTLATIAELLDIDLFKAKQVFQVLSTEGYIEPFDSLTTSDGDHESWQTTIKGNALAHATARKPITRQTADRVVQEFLNRVKKINACDDYVYRIRQVILFGSYLSDTPRLGDIDLSIVVEFRSHDAHKREVQSQERIKSALREGKSFRTVVEQATWPWLEIFHILKGGSPSLSLHDEQVEQVLAKPIPSKMLFDLHDTS
jgi:predicted nucleotidyltransferase